MILDIDTIEVVNREPGKLLHLVTTDANARGVAAELLGLFHAELDARIEDNGWKRRNSLIADTPTLIQLESLELELSVDGNEVLLSRVGGSEHEFDELCSFIGVPE